MYVEYLSRNIKVSYFKSHSTFPTKLFPQVTTLILAAVLMMMACIAIMVWRIDKQVVIDIEFKYRLLLIVSEYLKGGNISDINVSIWA